MDLNKRQLSCQRVRRVFYSAFRVNAAYNVKNASFSSGEESIVWVDIAYAQGTGTGGGVLGQLSPIFLFLPLMLIFYFMIIRPQQKQRREQQEMLDNLKEGDRVVTRGGITGQIDKVEKDRGTIRIEVGTGVKLRVKREYVDQVIPN